MARHTPNNLNMAVPSSREEALHARLKSLHKRLQWIADEEARSAWVNGLAAGGLHEEERDSLLEKVERALDELEAMNRRNGVR